MASQPGPAAETALCALRAVANGGEGALDRVRGADVLPVLAREVIEGEQRVVVFRQLGDCLVVFDPIGFHEIIEGGTGLGLGFGLPDVMQVPLCLRLQRFRQRVQGVHGLVDPAALFPRRGEDLAQGGPESQGRRRRWPAWGLASGPGV